MYIILLAYLDNFIIKTYKILNQRKHMNKREIPKWRPALQLLNLMEY